jgi:DNA-binding protein HU-beta
VEGDVFRAPGARHQRDGRHDKALQSDRKLSSVGSAAMYEVDPMSASSATASVVTLKTVFEQLGDAHDLPKKRAHAMLTDFVAAVTAHLQSGTRIRMSGLGILEVKKSAERMGRNPATGEPIQIKGRRPAARRRRRAISCMY